MKDLHEFIKDVERDLVIHLSIFTKYGRISFDESKEIAKEYLKHSPFLDYEQLFEALHTLSVKHRVVRRVYVKYASIYFDERKKVILIRVRNEISTNKINKAIKLMKSINYA